MSAVHLGIDIGGTASRWVACDATGTEVARGAASGATGHLFNPLEHQRLLTALEAIATALSTQGLTPIHLTTGLTGFGEVVRDDLLALLASLFALPPDRITVMDDLTLAYRALFAPGEGHVVSAGTGSIGIHLGPAGLIRVGGRGILIDDAGAGSWIARTALDRIYRTLDMTGGFEPVQQLADALFALVGGRDWDAVRSYVYGGDRGRVGALAVGVATAARAGDATAQAILEDAGTELARLGHALVGRAGRRPIAFIGGVLKLDPAIRLAIVAALPDDELRFPDTDAALAAARLGGR